MNQCHSDIKNKATVLSLLKEINKKYKIPILIISHSVEEIAQISDNVIILEKENSYLWKIITNFFKRNLQISLVNLKVV